jgi:DNA-directed RNA polymerase subunit beta'
MKQLQPKGETKHSGIHHIQIGVAPPTKLLRWGQRLVNGRLIGEVKSWETVNYKTLKPEPNGLFCQRIFGPVVDYTCACGKKSTVLKRTVCSKCGVEQMSSRVRRYRMGHIKLHQPVVHSLYASYKPSPLSLCLGWSQRRVHAVMYATEFCHLQTSYHSFLTRADFRKIRGFQDSRDSSRVSPKRELLPKLESKLQALSMFPDSAPLNVFPEFSAHVVSPPEMSSEMRTANFEMVKRMESSFDLYGVPDVRTVSDARSQQGTLQPLKKTLSTGRTGRPRFLRAKKIKKVEYRRHRINVGSHFYAIASDMTWRIVQEFHEFVIYFYEQPGVEDISIPAYFFRKIKSPWKRDQSIPFHQQVYPIQTGGIVFQMLCANLSLLGLERHLRCQHRLFFGYIRELETIRVLQKNYSATNKEQKITWSTLHRVWEIYKKRGQQIQCLRDFRRSQRTPAWMMLSYLPVLPPGLRPITSIDGQLVVSDINTLYRKILIRNHRLSRPTPLPLFHSSLSGTWMMWCYNLRQLQESVDSLLKTGSMESGKPIKSLLDSLKGKKGRFRQHLLGKRVDYSGRSVIVVGPMLHIHECGIPKQMAIELFQPFLIQQLRATKKAATTARAKTMINERHPIIWNILQDVMRHHPVILNRAPTLHRLGIQAFLPKLVEGKAILLHPLVCPGFNADFDGDQMAVHVPLSQQACSEALALLWSRHHLLSPASGQPVLLPTQDMVLGCYYVTTGMHDLESVNVDDVDGSQETGNLYSESSNESSNDAFERRYFASVHQVKACYDRGQIALHTPIWVKYEGLIHNLSSESHSKLQEKALEMHVSVYGQIQIVFSDRFVSYFSESSPLPMKKKPTTTLIRTTPGRILFHLLLDSVPREFENN